jgi:hypothetical protein
MRYKLPFLFFGMFYFGIVLSQQVEYKIIHDQPVFPKVSLNLDLMNMDANFGNFDNLSFNAGLWGYVNLTPKIETQFNIQKSYIQLGKIINKAYTGNLEINAGSAFFIKSITKTENVKVVLKTWTSFDGRTTISNFIMVPATVSYKLGIQGGAHYRLSPYEFEQDYLSQELNMTNLGFYAGGVLKRSSSTRISFNDGKDKGQFSANIDLFADAMLFPVNKFVDTETKTALTGVAKDAVKQSPLGFRLGCRLYQADSRPNTGKRFGLCFSASFGKKPYQGWFMTGSIGMTLLKSK